MVSKGSESHLTAPECKTSFRSECKRMSGRLRRATPLPRCARSGPVRTEKGGRGDLLKGKGAGGQVCAQWWWVGFKGVSPCPLFLGRVPKTESGFPLSKIREISRGQS